LTSFLNLLPLIGELEVSEQPLSLPKGRVRKIKAEPPVSTHQPRLPFAVYLSEDNIEIYVGRRAEDNDELSCNPAHRHDDEWWMHVSGHPGSHVVIKSTDDHLPRAFHETVLDAATLAAANSKANPHGKVTVSLTRCRNVSKPRGAAAGMVQLNGEIKSISVDLRKESRRLERLQKIR